MRGLEWAGYSIPRIADVVNGWARGRGVLGSVVVVAVDVDAVDAVDGGEIEIEIEIEIGADADADADAHWHARDNAARIRGSRRAAGAVHAVGAGARSGICSAVGEAGSSRSG